MNRRRLQSKCKALEKKCALLDEKITEANDKIKFWRNKYLEVKQNVSITQKREICNICGQTYRKERNAWQNHFMNVCPNVKNACQRIVDSYLLEENLEKNRANTDHVLESSVNVSVQLLDLNLLPEDGHSSRDFNDNTAKQSFNCDELCAYESVPEVSVEIEISNDVNDEIQNDDRMNTISIGY